MIEIFSDGACRGNPGGKGGWGVIIRFGTEAVELSGHELDTTNNRMELTAAYHGLQHAITHHPTEKNIMLCSDSKYVLDGIQSWMPSWKKNNWKASGGKAVKNLDLWMLFDKLISKDLVINCVWVRGHDGHAENERADLLANLAIDEGRLVPPLGTPNSEIKEDKKHDKATVVSDIENLDLASCIRLAGEAMNYEIGEWSSQHYAYHAKNGSQTFLWNPMIMSNQLIDLMSGLNIQIEYSGRHGGTDRVQASPRGYGHLAVVEIYDDFGLPSGFTAMAIIKAAASLSMEKKNACE